MEGQIVSFRRSRHVQTTNHMIVQVKSISKREKAAALVGKEVVWTSPAGKEIKGKVSTTHGNKGCLRVVFEKGIPGQALNGKVEIKS